MLMVCSGAAFTILLRKARPRSSMRIVSWRRCLTCWHRRDRELVLGARIVTTLLLGVQWSGMIIRLGLGVFVYITGKTVCLADDALLISTKEKNVLLLGSCPARSADFFRMVDSGIISCEADAVFPL